MSEPVPWAYGDDVALNGVARLVGAKEEEVALMNGLTVNLHILLVSFSENKRERREGERKR